MKQVTEADFRLPEYRDAKIEDYEFRTDGKLVRKDRFERGFRAIATALTDSREFEIEDIIAQVQTLNDTYGSWLSLDELEAEFDNDLNFHGGRARLIDVKLVSGSVLCEAEICKKSFTYEVRWKGRPFELAEIVGYKLAKL